MRTLLLLLATAVIGCTASEPEEDAASADGAMSAEENDDAVALCLQTMRANAPMPVGQAHECVRAVIAKDPGLDVKAYAAYEQQISYCTGSDRQERREEMCSLASAFALLKLYDVYRLSSANTAIVPGPELANEECWKTFSASRRPDAATELRETRTLGSCFRAQSEAIESGAKASNDDVAKLCALFAPSRTSELRNARCTAEGWGYAALAFKLRGR
jgi:hypothetical protein